MTRMTLREVENELVQVRATIPRVEVDLVDISEKERIYYIGAVEIASAWKAHEVARLEALRALIIAGQH